MVLFSLLKGKTAIRGKGFRKFNSSLTKNQNYITEIKKLICNVSNKNQPLFNRQLKWELLKYEVRKFTIKYIKHVKDKWQQKKKI